jgi:hypothetical protein
MLCPKCQTALRVLRIDGNIKIMTCNNGNRKDRPNCSNYNKEVARVVIEPMA